MGEAYKINEELKDLSEHLKKQHKQDLKMRDNKIKQLEKKINSMNKDLDELQLRFETEQQENRNKGKELMEIQRQLAQYRILWEHFFGLDAPLKDEIDAANDKLSKFERRHNIEPNVPRKKRKVNIERLTDWFE